MITAAGGRARGYRLDVTRREQIDAAVADAERDFGAVDILVNNAGMTQEKASVELTDEEWDVMIETNLSSLFRCARAVARGMIARGRGGKIVNIGSMYGRMGVARYLAYCTTKAAIDGLTKSLAVEWARHDIQVNCLAPGYINTDIPKAAMENEKTRAIFLSKVPQRRIGEPEELGPLAIYLASSASDFMTGQTIYIDGGQTIAW
jgi:NAD(P)-dependent dehydrogenase (short-subunit alcohol dehydrogenase family)